MKLMLVYNADSGIFNAVSDSVKKTITPDDYECSLCAVTYGIVTMRHEWRKFLGSLPMEKQFVHRDEIAKAGLGGRFDLPAIILEDKLGSQNVLVSREELAAITDLSDLIDITQERLDQTTVAPAEL